MEQSQNLNVDEIRQELKEALRDKKVSYAKFIGLSAVPVLAAGAIGLLGGLAASCFENHDVRYAASVGVGATLGVTAGYIGMKCDYIEKFRDFVDDIRNSSQRVRAYQSQLKSLETKTQ